MPPDNQLEIPAIVVHQWLSEWDMVQFSEESHRRKPTPHFYVFSLPAHLLRRLSGIYRRTADRPRLHDLGIQRTHMPTRSEQIRRFISGGFPWSDLSEKQKSLDDLVVYLNNTDKSKAW